MTPFLDPGRRVAQQDVNQIDRSKTLSRAVGRRQNLLSLNPPLPNVRRILAVVTVAAGFLQPFVEGTQKCLPATTRALAVAEQQVQALMLMATEFGVGIRLLNETAPLHNVRQAIEHHGVGW